jgi:hypothetical protein
MGLLIVLTITLLGISIMQRQPVGKVIILAGLILPLVALFVESAFRRVVVDHDRVTAYRPFRQRQVRFADVTSLESVRVRSRVFLTLVAGDDDFLIISNSYEHFAELLQELADAVPQGTVTEETEQLLQQPPQRQADIFTAWFAVIALIYILIAQFRT